VLLDSRYAPWAVLGVALLVTLPSIGVGFYADDHAFRAALRGTWPGAGPAWDLYRFATGNPLQNLAAIQAGALPWWSATGLKLHLIRPLPSLLFALDGALFGAAPLGAHLHSIAWYLALVASVGALFRQILPRATAHLALLIFALSGAHFFPYAWPSCRHMLVAAVPTTLGLLALVRDPRRGPWLCALGLGIGLASAESALVGVAFAIAYVGLASNATWSARARTLAPILAVSIAYLLTYAAVGGGASQSDGYVDPLSAPGRFITKAALLLPIMLGNALLGVPAELATFAPRLALVAIGLLGSLLAAWLARACTSSTSAEERHALPWLLCGAVLGLVPALGGFPGARMLLLPNLGFAPLLAVLIRHGLAAEGKAPRAVAWLFSIVHLGLPALIDSGNAAHTAQIARSVESLSAHAEIGRARPRVFVIGASDPMVTMYVPAVLAETAPERLACWSLISGAKQAHRVTRTGPAELTVRPEPGPLLLGAFETLFRSAALPFAVGDSVRQCGATYVVSEVSGGRPAEFRVQFDRPLGDPSLRLLVWKNARLTALAPPNLGDTLEIPWSPGPLGVF
jgi:hypothetical protein